MKKTLTIALLLSIFIARLDAQVILQDSFNYSDGLTVIVSSNAATSGLWTNYSGSVDSQIVSGHLQVFGSRSGDIWRPFTNTPASTIFASFIVNATNLPVGSNYFAHFSANATTFKGRVFGVGNAGTVPNTWRLGITAGSGTNPQIFPMDLATNVDYRVVISYDNDAILGTLWIDPVSTSDAKKQTIDSTAAATLGFFSFRQSNSGGQAGELLVDDLYVGNSFADVVGSVVKPPTIYYQPKPGPTTNFEGANMSLSCVAGGAGTVTFQWQKDGANLSDGGNYSGTTSNQFSIVSATTAQSGDYRCIVTSMTNGVFAGSVTSSVSQVVISVAPVPPTITTQPSSNNVVYAHQNLSLHVVATGPPSFSYQWYHDNNPISDDAIYSGANSDTLLITDIATANGNTGTYRVDVTNPNGTTPSSNAVVSVVTPAPVSIAYLRTLVDPNTFQPTNTPPTIAYQVTGTITTATNASTGNTASYFLQDATAGINIFVTFGSDFRPPQGEDVTIVGVLSYFSTTGLELYVNTTTYPYTSYTDNGTIDPLPTPKVIPYALTNTYGYTYVATNLAGSLVTLTNVYFGTNAGTILSTNTGNFSITVTNSSGQPFKLQFFGQATNMAGETFPAFASSVTGILYGGHPDYSVALTQFSDITTNVVVTPISLTIQSSGGNVILTWSDASFLLQSSTNVTGPYTDVGAGTGYSEPVTNLTKFYRLQHP